MSLNAGTRLGPYEIVSSAGAGGMGEVYKARDTRLDRTVAIKVLPTHLAGRAELRERFEREAKTIASLNHPHICTLYDTGHQDDIEFLVMEYIEGETLAQRLQKGPLPLDQVLRYAIEIADALDKAHRKGITHRDLKPGNIMLTKTGAKLLDFGLAKLKQDAAPATPESQLATLKGAITGEGTILGTLQYMAPEQVEAKEVDARTDIFAFGVVVYEMATGKKAFEGKSQASLMAKILETDPPPMTSLTPMTPPALDHVVKRCMEKDPDERWQSAKDICEQLRWISNSGSQAGITAAAAPEQKPRKYQMLAAGSVAIAIAVIAAAVFYMRRTPTPSEKQSVRFTVGPPVKGSFSTGNMAESAFSVSPDGTKLAFVAAGASGVRQIWIRALNSAEAQAVPGTENGSLPFWSPDSQFLGFSADGKLRKTSLSAGGTPETLAETAQTGGSWNRQGVILFTSPNGLVRVSESGGAVTPVTTLDASRGEDYHDYPQFLPDERHFLYFASCTKPENNAIFVGSLDSKERKLVLNANSNPVYVSPGYLLFGRQGTLMAQPFDADRFQLSGEAIPVADDVLTNQFGSLAIFAASDNGVLAYRGGTGTLPKSLAWVNRDGREQSIPAPPHNYVFPRISPDGQRIAAGIEERESQVWIYDISRDALARLTFEASPNVDPVWTPDGKRIVFKGKGNRLYGQPADGSGTVEELATGDISRNAVPLSVSPNGQELAFSEDRQTRSIYILSFKDRAPRLFDQSPSYESAPQFSPDGHWIAYISPESGRNEVYVRPYPGPGGKYQISTEGGTEPMWNPKGRELFYRDRQKMMAIEYMTTQAAFTASKPKVLFEGPYTPSPRSSPDYDVSHDGQRFLMLKASEQSPGQINVVLNWTADLKQKAPAGNK
ncbi:MAG TPA: protein kinase [Verrucomicrobiae bacterium]|nr:protein kinase [Verrucomicrobiae bacterium]